MKAELDEPLNPVVILLPVPAVSHLTSVSTVLSRAANTASA